MFKLTGVEVEDEGHVSRKRSLVAGIIWGPQTGQDRCRDLGGNAHENDAIHLVLH